MSTFSESILQASTTDNSSIFSTAAATPTSSTNWILWMIVALVAAFLGFALYNHLGGMQSLSTLLSPPSSSPIPSTEEQPQSQSSAPSPSVNEQALQNTLQQQPSFEHEVEADMASSSIQGINSKSGWCYIGEDRGFRSCAKVGVNDTCMSGEIFPSQEICINPGLRA